VIRQDATNRQEEPLAAAPQPDPALTTPHRQADLATCKTGVRPPDPARCGPDQVTTHHHGEADHLAWLERPFTEALRALDKRSRE
jgi:hypothetical protein